jgi:hypothetical protein
MTTKQQSLVTTPAPAEKPADKPAPAVERAQTPAAPPTMTREQQLAMATKAKTDLLSELDNENPSVQRIEEIANRFGPGASVRMLSTALVGVVKRDTARLGDRRVFVRPGIETEDTMITVGVKLSLGNGELYQPTENVKVGSQWEKRVVGDPRRALLTWSGMAKVNAAAGIIILQPPTIQYDGQAVANPHEIRNARGVVIRRVFEVVGLGRSKLTGNPVLLPYRVTEDASTPLVMGLSAIIKKAGDSPDPAAYYIGDDAPTPKNWLRIPANIGVDIVYNPRSPAVTELLNKRANAMEHAAKKIVTTAKRNMLREHPGMGYSSVLINGAGEATIEVNCWRTDRKTDEAFDNARQAIMNGATLDQVGGIEALIESAGITTMPMIEEQMREPDDEPGVDNETPDELEERRLEVLDHVQALLNSAPDDVKQRIGVVNADAPLSTLDEMRLTLMSALNGGRAEGEE